MKTKYKFTLWVALEAEPWWSQEDTISSHLTEKDSDCSDLQYAAFISAPWPLSPSFSFPFSDVSCFLLLPPPLLSLLGCCIYFPDEIGVWRYNWTNNHGHCQCSLTKQSSLSFLSTSAGERTWEVSKKSQTNSTDLGYFLKNSQDKKVQLLKTVRYNSLFFRLGVSVILNVCWVKNNCLKKKKRNYFSYVTVLKQFCKLYSVSIP